MDSAVNGALHTVTVTAEQVGNAANTSDSATSDPVRCEGAEVVCQADGRLKATWVRHPSATRYRLQISVTTTTSNQVAALPDIFVAQPAHAARTVIGYYDHARAGNRYEVRVAAEVGGAFTAATAPAGATCEAIAPPAPTGVTASCQAGTLTIEWDPAGEGLAEATSYKPRIFTGDPLTESTKWTANTAGHDMTTATIPATGEPALPTTGTFQVKVKATNTAGDSPYSDPVETTCGAPGPVTGLKCTAITKDQITIEWNTAVGASTYALTGKSGTGRGAHNVTGDQGSGEFTTDTLSDLRDDASYIVKVVATNVRGTSHTTASCRTLDDNWMDVDCPASNSMLHVTWDNSIDESQTYSVTIRNQGNTQSRTSSTASSWVIPGQPEQEYSVDIASTGVPAYSQSKTKTCRELDPFGRNHDPFLWPQEGGIDWPWEHDLDDEYTNFGYAVPFLITGVPEFQRTCSLSGTTWTCTEHWSEPAKIEIVEDWRDDLIASSIQIVEADGLTDTERNALSRAINWSIGRIARAVSWTSDKVLRIVIGRTASSISAELNLGEYILEMGDDDRVFAYIVGPTCLPDAISEWKSATFEMPDSITDQYTTQVGGYTIKRTYTVHYCKETA